MKPRFLIVTEARWRDGVLIVEQAHFAYSKPKLNTFTNGGWLTYRNESGNTTSHPVGAVQAIHALAQSSDSEATP